MAKKTNNKYDEFLKTTYEAVGGKENFGEIYHCVTRLRFKIIDKSKVNDSALIAQKKQGLVKGINWLGNELQVIIGMEVPKVFDAFNKYLETISSPTATTNEVGEFKIENKQPAEDISKLNKVIDCLKGFMLPMVPAVIGLGIIISIQAILVLTKAIPAIQPMSVVNYQGHIIAANNFLQQQADWFAKGGSQVTFIIGLMFYIGGTGAMQFVGVLILINGFKYLKLNPVFGAVLGLMICAPSMLVQGWNIPLVSQLDGWLQIKMGPIMGSIFVLVPSAFLFKYVKMGVDKVVPNALNNLFAGAIALFITTVLVFVALGPVIGIFENILGKAVSLLADIPFGLGVMFYAFAWQFMVITGAHIALVMLVMAPWIMNPTLGMELSIPMLMGSQIAAFGQMGAGLGIAFRTKDRLLKKTALDAAIPCVFGVTEPMIFGVTLLRIKALIFGCIGAAAGGLFFGLMEVPYFSQGGMGILALMNTITGTLSPNNGGVLEILYTLLTFAIAAAAAFGITFFLYGRDGKVDTKQKMKKVTNSMLKYVGMAKDVNHDPETLKTQLNEIAMLQADKTHIKNQQEYLRNDIKLNNLIAKLDKAEIKLETLKEAEKQKPEAINKLNEKIAMLNTKIAECKQQAVVKHQEITPINNQTITLINRLFDDQKMHASLEKLKNNYTNIINQVYKAEHEQPLLEEIQLSTMIKEEKKNMKIKEGRN